MNEVNLSKHFTSDTILVGIGNLLRGDDSFGPILIKKLQNRTSLQLIDAGSAPENFLESICKLSPQKIIIADAVNLDSPVGSLHFLAPDQLQTCTFSTHGPSIDMFVSLLNQMTDAQIHIMAVVPQSTELGQPLSGPVQSAINNLTNNISQLHPLQS
ncbi:MAG: hydrogenase maturation protease [Sedimentisphaerales bacterium]|nr:hydrogenase maturation protease [Sedimentisphaerales bacterium]